MSRDIEDLHQLALRRQETTYTDPITGFTVFTELAHLRRGYCCGNQCRHCPYGWTETKSGARRHTTVASRDVEAIRGRIEEIARMDMNERMSSSSNSSTNDKTKTGGRKGGTLTSKNVPYTRKGDQGTSQLLTGERRVKTDPAFEALGEVDELTSFIGVAHAHLLQRKILPELQDMLLDVMSRCFDIGSHVAKPRKKDQDGAVIFDADGVGGGFHAHHVDELERWIDKLTDDIPELSAFILPTGAECSAQLHVARCVCRRAERAVVPLVEDKVCDSNALKYLNRLSDFLFTAARWVNDRLGQDEIQYRKPTRDAKQRVAFKSKET